MTDTESVGVSMPNNILQPMLDASGSSTLLEALDCLIETAKTTDGRSELACKRIIMPVLQLCQFLSCPLRWDLLVPSLKLLRNLCAGEISNQNLFIKQNGVEVLSGIVGSLGLPTNSENGILRMLLQVLGNVSLGGEEHQFVVWRQFFPSIFLEISRVRCKETCDPLCMVLYTCSGGTNGLLAELEADSGMEIITEIIRTSAVAGFTENWLKLLLSRAFLEDFHFSPIFFKLFPVVAVENCENTLSTVTDFAPEQAFLLTVLSEIMNEQAGDIAVSSKFALSILGILRTAVKIVDFTTRAKSNLPTGSADIDVMGYSLIILRYICAGDGPNLSNQDEKGCATDMLVSDGLIELLITLLREMEPPAIIRKAMTQSEAKDGSTSRPSKCCPYKGFRRDIVAIIGNCCYGRKHVQDKIRQLDGIVLLLQQSVTDEENLFLREWGIWVMRNILEGNAENLKFVADLELQGSVDVPELTQMGLRVKVDPKSQRAKLVNCSSDC